MIIFNMGGVPQNKLWLECPKKKTKLSDLSHFMTIYFTKYDIVTYLHTFYVCILLEILIF